MSDTTGASSQASFRWTVLTRATATSVSCSPSTLVAGATSTCTATVSDTDGGSPSAPGGSVSFGSSLTGTFASGDSCTLAEAGPALAACAVSYQPAGAGTAELTAQYSGDATHTASSYGSEISVTAPPSAPSAPRGPSAPAPAKPSVPSTQITGTAAAGSLLGCPAHSSGSVSYQWTRDGTPIAGASSAQYRVQAVDEGTTLTCVVTAASAASVRPAPVSASVTVPVPAISGCPAATGRAGGAALGLARLGETRAQVRRAYAHSRDRAGRAQDTFCLTPFGVRVGYGPRGTLRARVAWILTGNAAYALDGIRVGASLAVADARLKLGRGLAAGANRWYAAPAGAATLLLEVRGGVVQEIGLAARSLTRTRAAQRALLRAL